MNSYKIHTHFAGRVIVIGFGSIARASMPLLNRHLNIDRERITIISPETIGDVDANQFGEYVKVALTRENYLDVLTPLVASGDVVLNLAVDVSSVDVIKFCQRVGALYLDTGIDPWAGAYRDAALSPSARSNYALREGALALRGRGAATAVLTHGANPGLVSHFVKAALMQVARDAGRDVDVPTDRDGWAQLACLLGVKVIHIAERDTQTLSRSKRDGEFINTWSVDGFLAEGCQPSELGWGSHERHFPHDASRHAFGCDAALYLTRPGASVRVRSWTPLSGPYHGFLITHCESISLADYFTVRGSKGEIVYRPTVHYAYHPCDAAILSIHELAGRNWQPQDSKTIAFADIHRGEDALGVLIAGHERNALWYGSVLDVEQARSLAPYNNATSLQVAVGVLAGVVWAIENPNEGVVDPEYVDHVRALEIATPYLGSIRCEYTEWNPTVGRGMLFEETVDQSDPWQFLNVRVT